MCLHDPEKIHSGLEKPLNPKELRTLLQEATLCSSCLYQKDTRDRNQERQACLFHHQTGFRNHLAYLAEKLKGSGVAHSPKHANMIADE